jgi:hypothetical protein
MSNPKNFFTALYYGVAGYLCFGAASIMVKGASTVLLGRFGKPQLVKETSKIYTNNYITIPFL